MSRGTKVLESKIQVDDNGYVFVATPSTEISSGLGVSQITFWLDEGADKLMFKVRYSDGSSIKDGEVALT
jgi:hypothetical protein